MRRLNKAVFFTLPIALMWGAAFFMFVPNRAFDTQADCTLELGTWQAASPAPSNHIEGASGVVDNRLYLITGFESYSDTLYTSNKVSIYDPVTNTWAQSNTPTPIEASHIQAAVDEQHIWLVAGFEGNHPGRATDQVWRYDTVSDRWAAGPNLPERRASGGVSIVDRKLHYISGLMPDRNTDSAMHWSLDLAAWENDPANTTWQEEAPLPSARNHFQSVVVEGVIYTVGGQFNHDRSPQDQPLVHAYDPVAQTWIRKADLPEPRSHAEMGTFVAHERILMVGGRNDPGPLADSVLEYNPQTDSWAQIGTLPKNLISPTANIIGNMMVVTAGGTAWNAPQAETWVAEVINNCNTLSPGTLQTSGNLNTAPVYPTFTWSPPDNVSAAIWFNLVVTNANGVNTINPWFQASEICEDLICTVTLDESALPVGLLNGEYTWTVRGYLAGQIIPFGIEQSFNVNVPSPAQPTDVDMDSSTGRPTITLASSPGATWLNVYIAGASKPYTHSQWYALDSAACNADSCTITPNAHPTNGQYTVYLQTWGPAGFNNGDASSWQGAFPFTLDFPPTPAVGGLNANASQNGLSLTWGHTTGTTWYQVWVGTSAPGYATQHTRWYTALDLGCTTTCTLTPPDVILVEGQDYTWFLRGWGPAGLSEGENDGWIAGETFALGS